MIWPLKGDLLLLHFCLSKNMLLFAENMLYLKNLMDDCIKFSLLRYHAKNHIILFSNMVCGVNPCPVDDPLQAPPT